MRKPHNRALAVLCSPHRIIGAVLSKKDNYLFLHQFFNKPLDHLELEKLTLFNPEKIGSLLTSWHAQSGGTLLCALHGPGLQEQMSFFHSAHPDSSQLARSHAPHWQWHHMYLYPQDHQHCFYVCGIKKSLVFQYQLMAINHGLPLALLTTERMALLHCYKALSGTAYRTTQLAEQMNQHHNHVERLFFKEDIARLLTIPSHITLSEDLLLPLLTLCGLYTTQGDYEYD